MNIDYSSVDLRTEREKTFDDLCKTQGEIYLQLLKVKGATKQRAIRYLCEQYGASEITIRAHLVRAGVYEFTKGKKK